MKKLVAAWLSFCMLASFSGCSNGEKNISIDGEALAVHLKESVAFEDQLELIDSGMAEDLYGLSADQVKSMLVYLGSGATAEEIAIIQVNGDRDAVEQAVEQRIEKQKSDFESYNPLEMPKLENPVIETTGNYVILCISGDEQGAEQAIEEFINKSESLD